MGVASLSEDIFDRLIDDIREIQSDLKTPGDNDARAEAHLIACESACERLLSKIEHAKTLAADPKLANPMRIAVLEIEKGKLERAVERAEKDLARVQSKFAEHRTAAERTLNAHIIRTANAETETRKLRKELKGKNEAIRHFGRTHRVEKKTINRQPARKKRGR